jgi:translocation and assembly module TamB
VAEGRTVELERLSGDDGEGGAVEMTGRADLGEQLAFRVAAALEGFTPMRTDDLEVTLSSPELVFEGGPSAATLRGEATLDRARLVVPELGGEGTPDVDVTEVNVPPAHRRDQTEKDGDYRLELDVAVDIPGRFVVIGQGLDAEFRGRIKATGTTDEPRLAGKLDIVRGEYDFLARRFTIEQATISFDGSQDPTPFLNIRAEADASDATAIVRVQGRADSPQIELSSQPALPRDEILSRVLFGKSVDQITPVQAVILADAARQLAQGGGGAGFFGRTRQAIGLDELDVVGDGDEGYAVQFGKYVTDRVYVEVEKGLEPERDKVKVEVEVTDDVSVESRAGQESSGVGVFWKHDY